MGWISATVVVLAALFLLGLAGAAFFKPALARQFLNAFASSARVHYLEQALRLVAGVALIIHAPNMWLSGAFDVLGRIVAVTSIALVCVPWRWHRRFAHWVVPPVIRNLPGFGLGALALGVFLLCGVFLGSMV